MTPDTQNTHFYYGPDDTHMPPEYHDGKFHIGPDWHAILLERYGAEWVERNCVVTHGE